MGLFDKADDTKEELKQKMNDMNLDDQGRAKMDQAKSSDAQEKMDSDLN